MAKRKKGQNSIRNLYSESWNFLKESRNFIYVVILIFVFSALIGFFIPASEVIKNKIIDFIKNLISETEGLSQFELIKFIFLNNVQSSFFAMILGIFLGIFPIITMVANGYLLGFVALLSVNAEGVFILWRLFPHGIFELPAIFISAGLGLKLGSFLFQKDKIKSFKIYLRKSLITFLAIVVPLLVIAAIIEGSLIFLTG